MTGVGLLYGIYGKEADGVNAQLINICGDHSIE
jgi:hypothetical protein